MASNFLLRPSLHPSPQFLKHRPLLFSPPLTKITTMAFLPQTPCLKALSITSQHSPLQPLTPYILKSPNPILKLPPKIVCKAAYETVPATDRLISVLSYFMPFLGGLSYGYHLFSAFPALERQFDWLVPLLGFYKSIPGANFLTFVGLYVGIVRDKKFSRFVRFNALQALFLEFIMVAPSLIPIVFTHGESLGYKIVQVTYGVAFGVVWAYFIYTLGFCLFGRTPRFPYVTDAMDSRLNLEDQWS